MQRLWWVLLLMGTTLQTSAQTRDTLTLNMQGAEQLLLQHNLALLVQHTSIDAARAAEITARLWNNPQLQVENVLYNPENHKVLDLSYKGETQAQFSQVFKIAGQRNKGLKLAQSGTRMSEYQFFDLLRTLRYTLHTDMLKLYYSQRSLALYGQQEAALQHILDAFTQQLTEGNVSQKDVLRLRSLLYNLQSDEADLQQDRQATLSDLQLLLRIPVTTAVNPDIAVLSPNDVHTNAYGYTTLMDSAMANRYDLKVAAENINYQHLNLQLQKALAAPDLQAGLTYDKQGSFTRNYSGLQLAFPLPVFNRNQGNIKMAKAVLAGSQLQLQGARDQVAHDVMDSYQQALRTEKLLAQVDGSFEADYEHLISEVQQHFSTHALSLLEFIDLYDSYRETILKLYTLRLNWRSALEAVNYSTASNIFHP